MLAIVRTQNFTAQVETVPTPQTAPAGHVLVKVHACAINHGDKVWLSGAIPPGLAPESRYDIAGGSGAGEVIALGKGVPERYRGKKVAFYRSLQFSGEIVGVWSEIACLPYLHCVALPDDADYLEYSGSLVNVITPYAFYQQVKAEGARAILCTAGTSATGSAMIGVCRLMEMPCLALLRKSADKPHLEALGAAHPLAQDAPDFDRELAESAAQLGKVAVFDGVGGETLSRVARALPHGASIYTYGFLGGSQPFCIHTSEILMKSLRISGFGNFLSDTVTNPQRLDQALEYLGGVMDMPHFKTDTGPCFRLDEIDAALAFEPHDSKRAVLLPGGQ